MDVVGRGGDKNQTTTTTTIKWSLLLNPIVRFLLVCLIEEPLAELWLNGPAIGNWGFHEGRHYSEICAYYTGVPATHWLAAATECNELVTRKLNAFVLSFDLLLYSCIMITVFLVVFCYLLLWIAFKCFCSKKPSELHAAASSRCLCRQHRRRASMTPPVTPPPNAET